MVGEGDGLAVEVGGGVVRGVPSVGDRDVPECLGGEVVGVQVALGGHGHPGGGGQQPPGQRPTERCPLRRGLPLLDPGPEAAPGTLVEGAVADDDLCNPRGDGEGGLLDGGAGRAASVVDTGEEGQVPDAGRLGDGDLGAGVHGEGDHAVDIGGGESGVVEGGVHGLDGELELAAAGVLGELGRSDAGDGGAAAELVAGADAHAGTSAVTVPVTWWPIPFTPTTRISMVVPEAVVPGTVAPETAVTVPVRVIVSPG